MHTSFDINWIVRTFSEKIRQGDTNPIIMQNEKDNNRMIIITPIFKNNFLIDVNETEIIFKDKKSISLQLPRNIKDIKNLFHKGKECLENFFYDIGILGETQELYIGRDENGNDLFEIIEYEDWRRVI